MKSFVSLFATICFLLVFIGFYEPDTTFSDKNYWRVLFVFFVLLLMSIVGHWIAKKLKSVHSSE